MTQSSYEGGQTNEVAIFLTPLGPWDVMLELSLVRHRRCLSKVYHPYIGLSVVVVHKEKRAANHLLKSDMLMYEDLF